MKASIMLLSGLLSVAASAAPPPKPPASGTASWYGEAHRGRVMANGKRFNPDALTAASWFYPLGTQVVVTAVPSNPALPARSITVTITDRGPARRLVGQGRIIDLSHGVFKRLAHPDLGLVPVVVRPMPDPPG